MQKKRVHHFSNGNKFTFGIKHIGIAIIVAAVSMAVISTFVAYSNPNDRVTIRVVGAKSDAKFWCIVNQKNGVTRYANWYLNYFGPFTMPPDVCGKSYDTKTNQAGYLEGAIQIEPSTEWKYIGVLIIETDNTANVYWFNKHDTKIERAPFGQTKLFLDLSLSTAEKLSEKMHSDLGLPAVLNAVSQESKVPDNF